MDRFILMVFHYLSLLSTTFSGQQCWGDDFYIFYPKSNSLTLDISGNNNTVHCLNNNACAYGKPLKLKGNGKLTVFADNYAYCGLVSAPFTESTPLHR